MYFKKIAILPPTQLFNTMRFNFKVYVIVLTILGLVYFMLPFSSKIEIDYDESYRTQSIIIEEQFDVVNQLDYESENIQFNNKTFYDLLESKNYFLGYKTEKAFEKELCEIPSLDIWESKIKEKLQ